MSLGLKNSGFSTPNTSAELLLIAAGEWAQARHLRDSQNENLDRAAAELAQQATLHVFQALEHASFLNLAATLTSINEGLIQQTLCSNVVFAAVNSDLDEPDHHLEDLDLDYQTTDPLFDTDGGEQYSPRQGDGLDFPDLPDIQPTEKPTLPADDTDNSQPSDDSQNGEAEQPADDSQADDADNSQQSDDSQADNSQTDDTDNQPPPKKKSKKQMDTAEWSGFDNTSDNGEADEQTGDMHDTGMDPVAHQINDPLPLGAEPPDALPLGNVPLGEIPSPTHSSPTAPLVGIGPDSSADAHSDSLDPQAYNPQSDAGDPRSVAGNSKRNAIGIAVPNPVKLNPRVQAPADATFKHQTWTDYMTRNRLTNPSINDRPDGYNNLPQQQPITDDDLADVDARASVQASVAENNLMTRSQNIRRVALRAVLRANKQTVGQR